MKNISYFLKKKNFTFKLFLISLVLVLITITSFAQQSQPEVLYYENRVAAAFASFKDIGPQPHYLGEDIGRKYAVFNDMYVYTVSGQVYQTGQQVVVDKPIIFNAVKKTNRYYRTLLRKKEITEDEAKAKVNHLLDVAISVYSQSTEALENQLRGKKKQDEIARIFEKVVLR